MELALTSILHPFPFYRRGNRHREAGWFAQDHPAKGGPELNWTPNSPLPVFKAYASPVFVDSCGVAATVQTSPVNVFCSTGPVFLTGRWWTSYRQGIHSHPKQPGARTPYYILSGSFLYPSYLPGACRAGVSDHWWGDVWKIPNAHSRCSVIYLPFLFPSSSSLTWFMFHLLGASYLCAQCL